jgi:hypothetical protein
VKAASAVLGSGCRVVRVVVLGTIGDGDGDGDGMGMGWLAGWEGEDLTIMPFAASGSQKPQLDPVEAA